MNQIEEIVKYLRERIAKATAQIETFGQCIDQLGELTEELGNASRAQSAPAKKKRKAKGKTQSGFVGVYPQGGRDSAKFYATVTEDKKTKRLPGSFETAKAAADYRAEYLAKRDKKQEEPEATTAAKRTFGPSNDRPVC